MGDTTVMTGRVARAVHRLPHPRILSKFVATGTLVGGTHLGLVSLLVVLGVPIQIALALGYAVALSMHFTLNRQWVFSEDSGYALHFTAQGARYVLTAGVSYAATAIAVALLPDLLGIPELAAFFIAAIAMAGLSFVALNFWVFRRAGSPA